LISLRKTGYAGTAMVLGGDKAGPTEGLAARGAALARAVAAWTGAPPERVRLVRSPYRACPLGAHVDHQLGHVTGFALDRALLLAFVPTDDGRVVLRSQSRGRRRATGRITPAAPPSR